MKGFRVCILLSVFGCFSVLGASTNLLTSFDGGMYLGGEIGADFMRGTVAHRITSNAFGTNMHINQQVASDGFIGGLHIGYGEKINRFYLGAEILGNLNTGKDNGYMQGTYAGNPLNLSFMFRTLGSLGVDVLPGIYLTPLRAPWFY